MPTSVLLSTAYFPPVRYFSKILQYENIFIEGDENYTKQTYRTRCNILSANGPLALTIPVLRSEAIKIPIRDILIDNDSRWKSIHWRAIESAYRNSPFYLYYADDIKDVFFTSEKKLFDFNQMLLTQMLEIIGVSKKMHITEKFRYVENPFEDFSAMISPKNKCIDLLFEDIPYYQVFSQKFGFVPELSILDLVFNLGPSAEEHLRKCTKFE